jgi:hypothetical protein
MRHEHPLTERRQTVELTERLVRGGHTYEPGHQFAVVSITAAAVVGVDADGARVVLPIGSVLRVADPPAERPRPTLAALKAAGLVKRGDAL